MGINAQNYRYIGRNAWNLKKLLLLPCQPPVVHYSVKNSCRSWYFWERQDVQKSYKHGIQTTLFVLGFRGKYPKFSGNVQMQGVGFCHQEIIFANSQLGLSLSGSFMAMSCFFAKRTPWTFGADCLLCLQGAIHTLSLFPIPILSFKTSFFLDWKWANWYISNIIRVQICSFNSIFSIHCGDRWCAGGGWAHYGTELLPGLYGQPALWYSMGGGRGSWAWG